MPAADKEFEGLLDRRIDAATPAEVEKIDAEIRARYERRVAVMITDMSGMTGLTRTSGILEILALIRRMQRLADPILRHHGGTLVKTEADDLFVIHESAKSIFTIAKELLEAANRHNKESGGNSLKIAVGLSFGPVIVLDGEVWGDAVNVASKLGEDTAAGGEILISEEFLAALRAEGVEPACSLIPASHRKAPFPYYACT